MEFKMTKRLLYSVRCTKDNDHVFEKIFEIEEGSEGVEETVAQTYCPECRTAVSVTVEGRLKLDADLVRQLREQQSRLADIG